MHIVVLLSKIVFLLLWFGLNMMVILEENGRLLFIGAIFDLVVLAIVLIWWILANRSAQPRDL